MIRREKDHLKKKKKKYLYASIIWLIIMFGIFFTGYVLNKTRNNIFTVIAAVFVLPVAQYASQLLTLWKYKDPKIETSNQIETIRGNYNLFHSALIPDQNSILYFDHIIVTGTKIYCIIDKPTDMVPIKKVFDKKIKAKGLSLTTIEYVDLGKIKNMGNFLKKIEKNTAIENEDNLKEYTHLIGQMMM